MIRLSLLWIVVSAVAIYTWRDWFKGLCGLILLLGVLEMPDVPRSMFGIEGLNFFNLLLFNVMCAWLIARHKENLKNDLPAHVGALLFIYLMLVLVGFYRVYENPAYLGMTRAQLISEYLINTLKWVVPGVMLYDGCRTRERTTVALLSVMGIYLFLGMMVVKVMPIRAVMLDGVELQRLAFKLLVDRIGYHRVTLSMMLAGASWAVLALRGLTTDRRLHIIAIVASFGILYAQGLTGGRAGYVTWGIIGLILCLLRWRGYLLIAPVMVAAVLILMPSVADRMLEGITRDAFTSNISVNDYSLTAGRTVIWPVVIEKIQRQMWFGYGRQGMWTTGTVAYISTVMAEDFGHPHNAYLEWILDNGVIGIIPVLAFYLVMLFHACRMFWDRRNLIFMAAGGVAAALMLALLGAGMGSQSFYPIEGTVGMWCAMGIMLRVSVNRSRALAALAPKGARASFSPMMAHDPRRAAAAAAALEVELWPKSEPIVPIGRNGMKSYRPPVAPPPEPALVEAGRFDTGRRRTPPPRPSQPAPDPDAASQFVFESIVPVRKS
jgi:O-antigen ligase